MIRDLQAVKHALTIPNGAFFAQQYHRGASAGETPSHFHCYIDDEGDFLQIPRNALDALQQKWFHEPKQLLAAAPARTPPRYVCPPWLHSRVTLRPRQAPASDALVNCAGDKILALACGRGKTVIALHALMRQPAERLPALVIVHTQDLMQQWVARIRQFWTMGLATPGIVQGSIQKWERAPIVIAMLQTLAKKQMPTAFYERFNTVIYDEHHRISAPLFVKTAPMFLGERWGLSATSHRPDGNERAFMLHCGTICYEDLTQDLIPKAFFVRTPVNYDMSRLRLWNDPSKVNFAGLATKLSDDVSRNALILEYIHRMAAAGRIILVLGERVQQLEQLAAQVPGAQTLIGAKQAKERRAALQSQVVFASSKLAKEGLDRPEFDCLVILNPTTDSNFLQQAIGRVQRACEGKPQPVVVFFEDAAIPPMAKRGHKIRTWLTQQKIPFSFIREHA